MKLFEIDGSIESIERIKKEIENNCQPYLSEVGIEHLPFREVAPEKLTPNFYDDPIMMQFKTRGERYSNVVHDDLHRIIDRHHVSNGLASRKHNVIITSSLGKNKTFGMADEHTPKIIPIGNFRYSYYPNDYNDIRGMTLIGMLHDRLYDMDVDTSNMTIDQMVSKFTSLVENMDDQEIYDKNLSYEMEVVIPTVIGILEKFGNIKSENLANAFSKENEIWFNCDSYYLMSQDTHDKLVGSFKGK